MKEFCTILLLLLGAQQLCAQVITQQQQWYGYFGTIPLTEKYSLHTDVQYIPAGFALGRVGLIRQFRNNLQGTAGLAASLLPVPGSGSDKLNRHEYRPWAQLVLLSRLGQNLTLSHRVRQELRILQQFSAGELQQPFYLTNRTRFQESLRLNLPGLTYKGVLPYVLVNDELLINFKNKYTYRTLDKNRLSAMIGGQYQNTRLQIGYMNRFVKRNLPEDSYINNHTFTLWLIHSFELRKREHEE